MNQTNFQKIIEFHASFGLPHCETVNIQNLQNFKIASLRVKLIQEEFNELCNAPNIVEQLDAIGDLLYVVYGAGTSFGFNLDTAFNEYCIRQFASHQFASAVCNPNNETNFCKAMKLCAVENIKLSTQHPDPSYIEYEESVDFEEQIREFSHALLMCNTSKVQLILVHMLYSLYSVGYYCGYDLDMLFTEIHRSNMSKLCNTEEEAIETVKWYFENQRDRYPEPAYGSVPNSDKWVVFDKTTDKRLKSIHYSPPKINPEKLKM